MKFKVIIPLLVLIALFVVTLPVAADQPGGNEDPFGGNPLIAGIGTPICRTDDRCGEIYIKTWVAPGGIPSRNSGDGTTPRKAIYIGGAWAGPDSDPTELVNCATVKFPAGNARWFKLDTWADRRLHVWLDDELNTATRPSGSAVFGAANAYMWGTAPGDAWQKNAFGSSVTGSYLEGFVLAIFDPDNLRPNNAFAPPNAALLTLNTDAQSKLLRGQDNLSLTDITGAGPHGYAAYNPFEPAHLLWHEGRYNGWVYLMAYNQMVWDGVASVCSQRIR